MKHLGKYLSALFMAVMLVTIVGCASTSKQDGTGEYVEEWPRVVGQGFGFYK